MSARTPSSIPLLLRQTVSAGQSAIPRALAPLSVHRSSWNDVVMVVAQNPTSGSKSAAAAGAVRQCGSHPARRFWEQAALRRHCCGNAAATGFSGRAALTDYWSLMLITRHYLRHLICSPDCTSSFGPSTPQSAGAPAPGHSCPKPPAAWSACSPRQSTHRSARPCSAGAK